jgi:hypothetical protein
MEGKHICCFCKEFISDDEIGGSKHGEPVCSPCLKCLEYGLPIKKKEVRKSMNNEIQKYNGNELTELKDFMYNILEFEDDDQANANITANQGMGVQLTNTMKKEGVTIIQNQSIVNKKVTSNVVKALRLLDKIKDNSVTTIEIETENKNIPEITMEHIVQVIEWIASKDLTLKEFDKLMRGIYCRALIDETGSSKQAAVVLGCSQSTASVYSRGGDEVLDKINGKQLEAIE